jgi:hypothetical protein
MKWQDTLGAGLVVVGIAISSGNRLIGMLFVGFGLGYSLHPHLQKLFNKK